MRVVLDTNVLVSAIMSSQGPPGRVVAGVVAGEISIAVDERVLGEYWRVLTRPEFDFDLYKVASLLISFEEKGEHVVAQPVLEDMPDPDDTMFLEVAIAAGADCIVTGNKRHFPAKACRGVRILSPAEFLKEYPQKARF